MAKFEFQGLDELQREFDKLSKNAEKLSKQGEVSMSDLFDHGFLSKCSRFSTFDEMMLASCFACETQEQFDSIPPDVFDEFIDKHTSYSSYDDLLGDAFEAYASKKLGF